MFLKCFIAFLKTTYFYQNIFERSPFHCRTNEAKALWIHDEGRGFFRHLQWENNVRKMFSFPGTSVELCDLFGSLCFRERMSDASAAFSSLEEERFCPPDCDAVSFTFSESSTDIRWERKAKLNSIYYFLKLFKKIVRWKRALFLGTRLVTVSAKIPQSNERRRS